LCRPITVIFFFAVAVALVLVFLFVLFLVGLLSNDDSEDSKSGHSERILLMSKQYAP